MKVAIVGSVDLTEDQEDDVRELIRMIVIICEYDGRHDDDFVLVSGGADGVDSIAEEVVKRYGWATDIKLPKEPNWENGYKPRNIEIAEGCDFMFVIRSRQSPTYGSGGTGDYAEKELGKVVYRYYV